MIRVMSLESSIFEYAKRTFPREITYHFDVHYAEFSRLSFRTEEYKEAWQLFQLMQEFYLQKYTGFTKETPLAPTLRPAAEQNLYALLFPWHECIQRLRNPSLPDECLQRQQLLKKITDIENELHALTCR
jgi:hypothetical protein